MSSLPSENPKAIPPSEIHAMSLGGASTAPERSLPSRNSRAGVLKIIAFFSLVVALAYTLHFCIGLGLRRTQTSKYGAFNTFISGAADADIVVSGSSRALSHYDPRVMYAATNFRTYNIGMNSSQSDVQLAILRTYLKHNRPPKLVIHNLDLYSFEGTRRGEIYNPALFVPYLSEPELFRALMEIDPAVWKWKHIPLYGYTVEDMTFPWIRGLTGLAGINPPQDYINGFNPRHVKWNADFAQFRATLKDGVTFKVEAPAVQALMRIVQVCSDNKIPIVLVYSPEYYEMQQLEINRKAIIDLFYKISQRYHVPFLDYSDSALSRDQSLFQNSQHLNSLGAEKFTEHLARELTTRGLTTR